MQAAHTSTSWRPQNQSNGLTRPLAGPIVFCKRQQIEDGTARPVSITGPARRLFRPANCGNASQSTNRRVTGTAGDHLRSPRLVIWTSQSTTTVYLYSGLIRGAAQVLTDRERRAAACHRLTVLERGGGTLRDNGRATRPVYRSNPGRIASCVGKPAVCVPVRFRCLARGPFGAWEGRRSNAASR